MYPNFIKENRRMSTCNQLDLQTLGSQPVMPKNLPAHCRTLLWILPFEMVLQNMSFFLRFISWVHTVTPLLVFSVTCVIVSLTLF